MRVLALVLAVPLIEIALFVTLGAHLGLWLTLAVVLGTGVLGVALLRSVGGVTRVDLRGQIGSPLTPMAHQGLIMLAAILLILPGFFTDSLGLLLLLPPVRLGIITLISGRVAAAGARVRTGGFAGNPSDEVIDGEYFPVDVETKPPTAPSKWTQD